MGRTLCLLTVLAVLLTADGALAAEPVAGVEKGLIPPPAISIPDGGKAVMEANLSDDDVLGIVKRIIPAIGEVAGSFTAMAPKGAVGQKAAAAISSIDFKEFSEAISGITNLRVVVTKYGKAFASAELMNQLDTGVAKLGRFSKVLSVNQPAPALVVLYAQSGNAGYVGYAFDSRAKTLYAARVLGFVDVAKLTKWVTDAMKMAMPKPPVAPVQPNP